MTGPWPSLVLLLHLLRTGVLQPSLEYRYLYGYRRALSEDLKHTRIELNRLGNYLSPVFQSINQSLVLSEDLEHARIAWYIIAGISIN